MKSVSKRGRRSRMSSTALEEQQEVPAPLKRTRSAHSSPAISQSTRSSQNHQVRRQDPASRPPSGSGGGLSNRASNHIDSSNHKEPSPIPEVPFDDEMPPDSKVTVRVESVKRRGSRDTKRPVTTSVPQHKLPDLIDDQHASDLSSLSELDSEAETERLEDSPRKGAPKSVFSYTQPSNKPVPIKLSVESKQNKGSNGETSMDEGDSQPTKKRRRENGEVTQIDVKTEDKPSRPATPLANKAPTPLEKSKKGKVAEISQEKPMVTAMEGIEGGPTSPPAQVNGEEPIVPDDQPELEPEAVQENPTELELEQEHKEDPPQDPEPEVDDEATESVEVSREDEEDAEPLQTRKAAADALSEIEMEFAKLREKLYEERISDVDEEIRLVNEGTHPELVAMMEAVDKRRDDKIRLYNTQLKYAIQSQHTTMTATRAQLHSQYSQQVREIRERYLDHVSEGLYQIQRERRASDMLVQDYTYRISEDRATRIRERQAYSMEVQILSGIAKYIGFPAAPEVKGAAPSEMQQDLEAMGIVPRVSTRGAGRGVDEYQEQLHRPHWGNRTAPPSPPQISQTHHHHHHHPHQHTHHHHMSHQEPSVSQRRPPGGSTSISNPTAHMSPVTPLSLSALLQDSGPIKLEQGAHSSPGLHPPSMTHANRSPLHQYRPPLPPQAHIHQLQHQHLHQGYGRANSLEPGERELEGRGRLMDEKDIGHGGLGQLGIVRYAPVGKGYV